MITNKTIKNLFQVTLILISFLTLFKFIDLLINPRFVVDEPREALYLLEEENNSVFLLGSSHVQCSFSPNILGDIVKEETFINLTISGGSTSDFYYYLKAIIEKGYIPSIVIFETYALRSDKYTYVNNLYLYDYNYYKFFISNINNFSFSKMIENSSSIINSNAYSWKYLLLYAQQNWNYINSNNYLKNDHIFSKGYHESKNIIEIEKFNEALKLTQLKEIDYETIQFLVLLKELCQEYDITLIATRAPNLNTLIQQDKETLNLMQGMNITYIDLNKYVLEEIHFPQLIFRDVYFHSINEHEQVNSHLNDYGATYSTLKLAKELSIQGYFDIDQEEYQKYWDELDNQLKFLQNK